MISWIVGVGGLAVCGWRMYTLGITPAFSDNLWRLSIVAMVAGTALRII